MRNAEALCTALGLSVVNLLFGLGLGAASSFCRAGVATCGLCGASVVICLACSFASKVAGAEDWCAIWTGGCGQVDFPLVRGNGNSSAGGISKVLVPPSSEGEAEEVFI